MAIDNTGDDERFVPSVENDNYFAFLSLYAAVRELVAGKVVLDAGCGAGYGSYYLANGGARVVVALDASLEGVRYAVTHYSHPNLRFVLGDCTRLPLPAGGFDVVFSSNVIEHVADYEAFLVEAKRVMNRHGVLMMVTPPVYENVPVANPFHVTNLTASQWDKILHRYFDGIRFFKHFTPNRSITFTRPLSEPQASILTSEYFAGLSPELQGFLRRKIFNPLNGDLADWEITKPATLRELEEPLTCSVIVLCSNAEKPDVDFSGTDRERLLEWRVESLRLRLAETEAVLYQLLTKEVGALEPKEEKFADRREHVTRASKAWWYIRKRDLPGLWREAVAYTCWRLRR